MLFKGKKSQFQCLFFAFLCIIDSFIQDVSSYCVFLQCRKLCFIVSHLLRSDERPNRFLTYDPLIKCCSINKMNFSIIRAVWAKVSLVTRGRCGWKTERNWSHCHNGLKNMECCCNVPSRASRYRTCLLSGSTELTGQQSWIFICSGP